MSSTLSNTNSHPGLACNQPTAHSCASANVAAGCNRRVNPPNPTAIASGLSAVTHHTTRYRPNLRRA
ncbi:hypothetical protein LUPAC07_03516 [Micromonospora noduli]|nr:hypothetical protein LUPAC07_03516 [Micromonospora noduli]